jgi:hypothetical protein
VVSWPVFALIAFVSLANRPAFTSAMAFLTRCLRDSAFSSALAFLAASALASADAVPASAHSLRLAFACCSVTSNFGRALDPVTSISTLVPFLFSTTFFSPILGVPAGSGVAWASFCSVAATMAAACFSAAVLASGERVSPDVAAGTIALPRRFMIV